MMPIPRRSEILGTEEANVFWHTLAHNDWVLIRGITMGFYSVNCMVSKGWTAHLSNFLDDKLEKQ